MSAAIDTQEAEVKVRNTPKKNPSKLYQFALGYFAERLRNGRPSMRAVAEELGISQSGYHYAVKGESSNWDLWCRIYEHWNVDIVSVLGFCRVLVKQIQIEEAERSQPLDTKEREALADLYFPNLPFSK